MPLIPVLLCQLFRFKQCHFLQHEKSPYTLLHNLNFLLSKAVEFVDHAVDFAVGLGEHIEAR